MKFICTKCQKEYPLNTLKYKCDCGGLFNIKKNAEEKVEINISLGEVKTPIVKRNIYGINILLKMDYLMPSGSFKDRGAITLVNKIKEMGIEEIVEDSSGNAGAAIAAYAAAAGIKCNIYLPENTSQGKIKQIEAYGANIVKVPGIRDDTSRAIKTAAEKYYYASHVYNPLFFEGTKSIAYEIYDEIGIPDYLFVPTGNGTMFLGAYYGFKEIGKLPKLIAIQSENCATIYNKYNNLENTSPKETLAEGIAIGTPMRIDEIIEGIKESKGDIITVSDEEVKEAKETLSHMGIYVEYTSAATLAGVKRYFKGNINKNFKIVVPLTGTGLKK